MYSSIRTFRDHLHTVHHLTIFTDRSTARSIDGCDRAIDACDRSSVRSIDACDRSSERRVRSHAASTAASRASPHASSSSSSSVVVVTRARARRTTHAEHTRRRAGISRTRARTHGRTHGVMATDTASRGVGVGAVRGYWDASEERALRRAVQKHGIGAWEKMRNDPEFVALRCVWRIARIAHCGARAMRAVARRAAAAFPNATFDDDDSSSSSRVTLAWCAVLGGGRACA